MIRFILITLLLTLGSNCFAMKLNLQYPPTPDNASKHAEKAVEVINNIEKIKLDYSPDSLKVIDNILQSFHAQGLTEVQVAETVFIFGCYAGEVYVKNLEAKWANPQDVMPKDIAANFPFMVVQLPDGKVFSPITKAFNQLNNGKIDSLEYLYQTSKP